MPLEGDSTPLPFSNDHRGNSPKLCSFIYLRSEGLNLGLWVYWVKRSVDCEALKQAHLHVSGVNVLHYRAEALGNSGVQK